MVPILAAISTIDSLASGAASLWKDLSSPSGASQTSSSGTGETASFASVLSAAKARGGSHAASPLAQSTDLHSAGLHSGGTAQSLAAASGAITANATAHLLDRLA